MLEFPGGRENGEIRCESKYVGNVGGVWERKMWDIYY